jgi:hypothetical protein
VSLPILVGLCDTKSSVLLLSLFQLVVVTLLVYLLVRKQWLVAMMLVWTSMAACMAASMDSNDAI